MIKLSLKQMKNSFDSFVATFGAVVISYLHTISESVCQSPLDNFVQISRVYFKGMECIFLLL